MWKRFTKKQISIKLLLKFLDDCENHFIGECDLRLVHLLQHWLVTLGDTALSRENNLRIHLLVGCEGLENDTVGFRCRNNLFDPADPTCKLCSALLEDAHHFISVCPS